MKIQTLFAPPKRSSDYLVGNENYIFETRAGKLKVSPIAKDPQVESYKRLRNATIVAGAGVVAGISAMVVSAVLVPFTSGISLVSFVAGALTAGGCGLAFYLGKSEMRNRRQTAPTNSLD